MKAGLRRSGRLGRAASAGLMALIALGAVAACTTTRSAVESSVPAPPPAPPVESKPAAPLLELPAPIEIERPVTVQVTSPPPCVCTQPAPNPSPKKRHTPKRPTKEREPQPVGPAPPVTATVVNAEVGRIEGPLTSILGKNVYGPKGEELGRVVDLLADSEGRVRVAIIDFGGFLGVGTRRIAVDWPLLHFTPRDKEKPLVLTVTREKLQAAPEYKDSASPRVLMPPADTPDAAGAGDKK